MENRSLVTIANYSKEKILYLLEMAHEFEKHPNRKILDGKVVATLFFEPSTRTRLSFETAAGSAVPSTPMYGMRQRPAWRP